MNLDATSTATDVLNGRDLRDKHVLITGVSSGVGAETALVLAEHGAAVIGTARDLAKGAAAIGSARGVDLVELDLSSLASVRACADMLAS